MENGLTRYRAPHPQLVNVLKQRRSGYEPSDTETDWQDSPMRDRNHKNGAFGSGSPIQLDLPRNISPLKNSRRHSSRYDDDSTKDSVSSPPRRRHSSKSPYKPQRDDDGAEPMPNQRNDNPMLRTESGRQVSPFKEQRDEGGAVSPESSQRNVSPLIKPDQRRQASPYKVKREDGGAVSPKFSKRNVSPLSKPEQGRQISPYKPRRKEHGMHENGEIVISNRRKNQRTSTREERSTHSQMLSFLPRHSLPTQPPLFPIGVLATYSYRVFSFS